MSFLTPLFLAALAALAIPVLLHLIQREKKTIVPFPSLMFLRRIPYQSVRRRRIRNWLLLVMRLAAIALVAFAFARPFLRGRELPVAAASGARELVVLIDRSYSMTYGDRWQRALRAARQAIDGMVSGDRASIVFFASGAEVALRSTADKSRLQAAVAGGEPSSSTTQFAPALKLAGSILGESGLPRREAVIVSDFQRNGWKAADGVRLPDGAVLTPVSVGDGETANLAVVPVSFERSTFSNQERITITAGVMNHGERAIGPIDVALEVDGRAIQTQQVRVEPHGSASTTFAPLTIGAPHMRASIRIPNDALACDNLFHFVVSPGEPVRILLVQPPMARDSSLYLTRALAVGESPRFEVTTRGPDALVGGDLTDTAIVLLNDVAASPAAAERLGAFVQRGGGLFVVAGQRATWPKEHAGLVPAMPGDPVDRSKGQPARLVALEYGHSIFEPFRAPRSGDFSSARFYGYRTLALAPGSQILARFDDGSPALVERRAGAGRALTWASSLDLSWNDLAVKPVYLPFLHQVTRHLAVYREPAPWFTVGDVLDPLRAGVATKADMRTVVSPSGKRLDMDSEGAEVVELLEQGFYDVRGGNSRTGAAVAVNVDLTESDLTPMDPTEIVAAATGRAGGGPVDAAAAEVTDGSREAAQKMWWYLLFAGAILLAGETLVSNRMGR